MTDRYTKAMLTIIALCLVLICLRDTAPSTYAQIRRGGIPSGTMDVNIRAVGGSSISCESCGTDLNQGLPIYSLNEPQ
jgi:hypothetical protein